ncbi:hypothetical protein [Vibrio algicola]|uniref:Uncharacterized protein n=1 Tax=Vibrio algicola TaxID=2662262 RepID=A0A5Q0TCK0_9VIBR|nr:hypothetical protein [Vibrio algicola]
MPIISVKCVNPEQLVYRRHHFHYQDTAIPHIIALIFFLVLNWVIVVSLSPLLLSLLLIQLSFKLYFDSDRFDFEWQDNCASYPLESLFVPVKSVQTELRMWLIQIRLEGKVIHLWRHQFSDPDYRRLLVLLTQESAHNVGRLEIKKEP